MPPFPYRQLNAQPPEATESELEELDEQHPSKNTKKSISQKPAPIIRRKKTFLNKDYKLALVALHFGSLTDFSQVA